jgi:hypothetical protein
MGGLPGRLEHRPWVNFGYNRTELMDLAYEQGADWLVLLDADMVLEVDGDLHQLVSTVSGHDMLLVNVIGGDMEFAMPYVVRGNRHWRFEGVTHEYLTTAGRPQLGRLPAVRLRNLADGGSRQDKYERDRRLLESEYERNPADPRTAFYLAQTYRGLGDIDAAVGQYTKRAAMVGWDEETFYAQYQVGALQLDRDWPVAVDALLRAWSLRPTRAEPLYHLALGWRNRGAWPAAYLFASRGVNIPVPDDILFVETPIYRWGLRFERSVAAWYVGERELALADSQELIDDPDLPETWRVFVERNLRLAGE